MQETLSTRSRWTVTVFVLIAVAALTVSVVVDPREPTGAEWRAVAILAIVAVIGHLVIRRSQATDSESAPPWDVHSAWLLPAALLAPPLAFLPLVALSVALSLARRKHRLVIRLVVVCITLMTTASIHLLGRAIEDLVVAGLAGIVAQYLIGVVIAVAVSNLFLSPTGTALWLDYRWSLVQLGCAFSALLTAVAMTVEPWAGLAALAPLLLSAFALNWPELDRRARVDAKTGLPNAQHWEDRSRDLISAAAMQQVPATVMILDLDEFKQVNDTYGHLVGDEVLENVASVLRSQINPGDVVGRFGGEEFVITMFALPAEAALTAAERIRRAVAETHHHVGRGGIGDGGDSDWFRVTCTIGVCTSAARGYELTELLAAADTALATGKVTGRNRVELAGTVDHRNHTNTWTVATRKRSWMSVAQQQRRTRAGRD